MVRIRTASLDSKIDFCQFDFIRNLENKKHRFRNWCQIWSLQLSMSDRVANDAASRCQRRLPHHSTGKRGSFDTARRPFDRMGEMRLGSLVTSSSCTTGRRRSRDAVVSGCCVNQDVSPRLRVVRRNDQEGSSIDDTPIPSRSIRFRVAFIEGESCWNAALGLLVWVLDMALRHLLRGWWNPWLLVWDKVSLRIRSTYVKIHRMWISKHQEGVHDWPGKWRGRLVQTWTGLKMPFHLFRQFPRGEKDLRRKKAEMAKGILEVQLIDAKGLKNTDLIGNSQSSASVGSRYVVGLIGMRWPQARSTRTWWFNTEAKSARAKLPEVSQLLLCGRSGAANWWHELLVSSSSSTNKIISWFHE